jgi:enoyl-CoA hydratase/carnithine racemase
MHDAGEALAMGVLDALAAPGELDSAVDELVHTIAGNAPLTIRALKAALGEAVKPSAQRDEARVQAMVDACHTSADYQEGQRAFAEKRTPRFRGC